MISSTQMRPGMVVKFNNDLFSVFSVNHRTPGNLRGFVQAKMRNLRSGTMIEHRFSSEDKVERAALEEHEMEYLYDDGEYFYFMNTENYEQMHLTKDLLGDAVGYLVPQLKVAVEFYEGNPISVELPATVDLTVVETEPGMKGASVSNVTKPAKLETGLVVQVPPFITEGEKIRVSTAEGTYQERARRAAASSASSSGRTADPAGAAFLRRARSPAGRWRAAAVARRIHRRTRWRSAKWEWIARAWLRRRSRIRRVRVPPLDPAARLEAKSEAARRAREFRRRSGGSCAAPALGPIAPAAGGEEWSPAPGRSSYPDAARGTWGCGAGARRFPASRPGCRPADRRAAYRR